MRPQFLMWLALAALHLGSGTQVAFALDVVNTRWGFDGRLIPEQFNLLTVEVVNNSTSMFNGDLVLRSARFFGGPRPDHIEKDLQIEPQGRRKIQFFPYITSTSFEEDLELAWGSKPEESAKLIVPPSPPQDSEKRRRATILLTGDGWTRVQSVNFPQFHESDLPISASGMDTLGTLLLDYVPRWDPLRKQAFRDWIGGGGQVHLFQATDGSYPKFTAPLEALNEASDVIPLGSGLIKRHPLKLADLDKQRLVEILGQTKEPAPGTSDYWGRSLTAESPLTILRSLTRPKHNWELIFLLALVYLAVIFPGIWALGRYTRADWRFSYLILAVTVLLFSGLFHLIGRRGYDEVSECNSAGIARRVGPGRFLYQSLDNVFEISGGTSGIRHAGEGLLYSSVGRSGNDDVVCINRPQAEAILTIPSFASNSVLHSAVVTAPDFDLELLSASTGDDKKGLIPSFTFRKKGEWPADAKVYAAYGSYWSLYAPGGGDTLTQEGVQSSMLQTVIENAQQATYRNFGEGDRADHLSRLDPLLPVWQLKSQGLIIGNQELTDTGNVYALVFAKTPDQFLKMESGQRPGTGRVSYLFKFPIHLAPASPPESMK